MSNTVRDLSRCTTILSNWKAIFSKINTAWRRNTRAWNTLYRYGIFSDIPSDWLTAPSFQVETYHRSIPDDPGPGTKIQVIATSSAPVDLILRNFGTTAVVNIISWEKAYSLFPVSTFVHYDSFLLRSRSQGNAALLAKYTARGWNNRGPLPRDYRGVNHPVRECRRIGDRWTWGLPLDVNGVVKADKQTEELEKVCFSINSFPNEYYSIMTS